MLHLGQMDFLMGTSVPAVRARIVRQQRIDVPGFHHHANEWPLHGRVQFAHSAPVPHVGLVVLLALRENLLPSKTPLGRGKQGTTQACGGIGLGSHQSIPLHIHNETGLWHCTRKQKNRLGGQGRSSHLGRLHKEGLTAGQNERSSSTYLNRVQTNIKKSQNGLDHIS